MNLKIKYVLKDTSFIANRDIKPNNFILASDYKSYIISDFGEASV